MKNKRAFQLSSEEKKFEQRLAQPGWNFASQDELERDGAHARAFLADQKKEARVNIRMSEIDIELQIGRAHV